MTAFLEISKVSMRFGASAPPVLEDVTLNIGAGDYVSVIGHSGCGKSTLMNIVAGLLKASVGGVLLEGTEVDEPGPDRAVVFQNHSLLPWLTCRENVRLAVDQVFGEVPLPVPEGEKEDDADSEAGLEPVGEPLPEPVEELVVVPNGD